MQTSIPPIPPIYLEVEPQLMRLSALLRLLDLAALGLAAEGVRAEPAFSLLREEMAASLDSLSERLNRAA